MTNTQPQPAAPSGERPQSPEQNQDVIERLRAVSEPQRIVAEVRTNVERLINELDRGGKDKMYANFGRKLSGSNTGTLREKVTMKTQSMTPNQELEVLTDMAETMRRINQSTHARVDEVLGPVLDRHVATQGAQPTPSASTQPPTQPPSDTEPPAPPTDSTTTSDAQEAEAAPQRTEARDATNVSPMRAGVASFWQTFSDAAEYFNIFSEKFWLRPKNK